MGRGRKPSNPIIAKIAEFLRCQYERLVNRREAASIALNDVEALGLGTVDQMVALNMIGEVMIIEDDAERATATDDLLCEIRNRPELLPLMNSDAVKGLILTAALHRQQTAPEKATARKRAKERSDTAAEAYEVAVMGVDLGVGELASRSKGDIAQELAQLCNQDTASFIAVHQKWRKSPSGVIKGEMMRREFDYELEQNGKEAAAIWANKIYQWVKGIAMKI